MSACASLGYVRGSGVSQDLAPVVLVNGVPEPRLAVETYKVEGPLNVRSARLRVDAACLDPGVLHGWVNAAVMLAMPVRLVDDQVRWPVLMLGRLEEASHDKKSGRDACWFDLVDAWSETLARPIEAIWWRLPAGALLERDSGSLTIGRDGNRSADRYAINGKQVHVIQEDSGIGWMLSDVLEMLSAVGDLGLSLQGLPGETARSPLVNRIDFGRPLSFVLKSMFEAFGLVLQRDIRREDGTAHELRMVRPVAAGRPIRLVWPNQARVIGDVLEVNTDQPAQSSRLWIARADGWRVESTFNLVGGWDPALEGQADDEYDKKKSSDFATYADVYRRWVLNEDGFYTSAPYYRGAAFDLTSFFGTGEIDPQPLVFRDNLTCQGNGKPYEPIIEVSTDGGSQWTLIDTAVDILKDRAGIYLDQTTLFGNFLTAAKSGQARVRVTACLISPLPVESCRWFGNPYTSTLPEYVLDVSDLFFFHRVDSQSIHYADVMSGIMTADVINDSYALSAWLTRRVTEHARGGDRVGGEATLELAGIWFDLRVGDRLLDVGGRGVAIDGQAQALTDVSGTIRSVEARLATGANQGRTTRVRVTC